MKGEEGIRVLRERGENRGVQGTTKQKLEWLEEVNRFLHRFMPEEGIKFGAEI